jgi:excisionase family DNA binding protein
MSTSVLTVNETAKRLRVTTETVRRWCRDGTVFPHAFQLPGGQNPWRIPERDVEAVEQGRSTLHEPTTTGSMVPTDDGHIQQG